MTVKIIEGDALAMLRTLPAGTFQCCVTSPPYFGLRDYGVEGQMGLEESPEAFVAGMVAVFREVRRVLRDDGTLWLNIGDSYASSPPGNVRGVSERSGLNGAASDKYRETLMAGHATKRDTSKLPGIKPKDMIGIPWMLAFALRADGWFLRCDVIWSKPNPMPESVTDRCTKAHEYVFLLTKRPTYFYDQEAIREGRTSDEDANGFRGGAYVRDLGIDNAAMGKRKVVGNKRVKVPGGWDNKPGGHSTIHRTGRTEAEYVEAETREGRNARSVWTIATEPFKEAHFATMPTKLALRCVLAGSSERGQCPSCGAPWERLVKKTPMVLERSERTHSMGQTRASGTMVSPPSSETIGWAPTCACCWPHDPVPQHVLDPFGGAGTTALVADRLGRDATIIELNPASIDIARRRITGDSPLFAEVEHAAPQQG